ncbi:hypothetical protein [Agathobacter rectalis]|uniref:hypothetical protein n=1 Tax=Agathobacter rectalis TaxID=39491 RepID=UPI0032C0397B
MATASENNSANSFWRTVNKEDSERNRKYKDITDRGVKNVRDRRRKSIVTAIVLLIAVIAAIFGIMQFGKYQNEMTEQVMSELVGKTFTASDSHMEGLGWIHYEYWQLTFKDEDNLDYAYIETVGPREDDEKPVYEGTYSYTLSRSMFGNYTVSVNGTTYKIKVNDSNEPTGISR